MSLDLLHFSGNRVVAFQTTIKRLQENIFLKVWLYQTIVFVCLFIVNEKENNHTEFLHSLWMCRMSVILLKHTVVTRTEQGTSMRAVGGCTPHLETRG